MCPSVCIWHLGTDIGQDLCTCLEPSPHEIRRRSQLNYLQLHMESMRQCRSCFALVMQQRLDCSLRSIACTSERSSVSSCCDAVGSRAAISRQLDRSRVFEAGENNGCSRLKTAISGRAIWRIRVGCKEHSSERHFCLLLPRLESNTPSYPSLGLLLSLPLAYLRWRQRNEARRLPA
jgi:hypothetical protein